MKKITQGFYDPALFGKRTPLRDHGSREAVERDGYSVRVINRGEQLSYIDAVLGEVVAEIFIPNNWIDADSIKLWDDERPVTPDERAVILERVANHWQDKNNHPLRVIHGAQP
jgi:hypothetical protein